MDKLEIGLVGEERRTTEIDQTAQHLGNGGVHVLATPVMIAMMERAAVKAVDHLLPEGQQTVGIYINAHHTAPTPVGMEVTTKAELIDIEGRILTFRVSAEDENEQVGEGTHKRAIIDVARFQDRVNKKVTD